MSDRTDRREFLKRTGAVAAGVALASAVGCSHPTEDGETRWAMVIDTRKCEESGCSQECESRIMQCRLRPR